MKRKTTTILARAAMMLLVAVLSLGKSFAAAGTPTNGFCGDPAGDPTALTWQFDMLSGTLTISGQGEMADFDSPGDSPWYAWADDVRTVMLSEGVTHIGNYAFQDVPLTSIQVLTNGSRIMRKEDAEPEAVPSTLPESLNSIGKYALYNTQMTSLTLPSELVSTDNFALACNSQLVTLTCLGTMTIPNLGFEALASCNNLSAIYVPKTCVDDYKNADSWSSYASLIKPIPEGGDEPGGDDEPTTAGTITIGSGDWWTDLPITAQYKYAMSQQVFSAAEISHAKGKIWSMAFKTHKGDLARNLTVYLTHSNYASVSLHAVTEADRVFTGEVMFTAGQWNTIYFEKPFEYDGKSSIIVTVDDNTGTSDGWGSLQNYYFYGDGGHAIARDNENDIDPLDEASIENASQRNSYSYKSQIQFTFGAFPTPTGVTVSEIGDVSVMLSTTLRGGATAWNVRYRGVAKEGDPEMSYNSFKNITDPSFVLSGLTAATKYEVQVQAVFADDNLSGWTDPVTFTTACCPANEQGEIIYALNSNYSNYYGYAVQIVDAATNTEVAYLNPADYGLYGGTLTLCCGHTYKVNWIYDAEHPNTNKNYSLALYFEPGDEFFYMASGEAPEETAELTTFVMDCTPYCAQKPKNFAVTGSTYNMATLSFSSETTSGHVAFAKTADFDPESTGWTEVNFTPIPADPEVFEPNPANSMLTLTGLESLTDYYVRVRSVCEGDPAGLSRWSDPVKLTTGSLYDAPGQVTAQAVDSRTEKLSWKRMGGENKNNLYYRVKATGNPIDASSLATFGNVKDKQGFEFDGDAIWSSYGYGQRPFSNVLYYPGIPAGSSISFNVANWNSKGGLVQFLWGFKKSNGKTAQEMMETFDMECLNDADRAARIKALQEMLATTEDDKLKAKLQAAIDLMYTLPTDAQKLERMKELENMIKNSTSEAEKALNMAELSNLRAIMSAADQGKESGFSVSRDPSPASARGFRAPEDGDGTYTFFIRHANDDGYLAAKDFTLTAPEDLGEWICIPNISKTEYTLTSLLPGTAYEVMVEPVYDDGTKGSQSVITVFTTIGEETDPIDSDFSVSATKKVQFAKGNLQYEGDYYGYEGKWSIAKQQYEMLGEENVETYRESSTPAYFHDLFCWSNNKTHYGHYSYYYDEADETQAYFHEAFAEWGENPSLIAALGAGWSTLSKDEWTYLLNGRKDADKLKAFATVADVKGIVLLPDEWKGAAVASTYTAEEWAAMQTAGAVFLPAAGQMNAVYNPETYGAITTYTTGGYYWTCSPADATTENALDYGSGLTFDEATVTTANLSRRTYSAVRLVKVKDAAIKGDANGDGVVNVSDVTAVINKILGKNPQPFNETAADVTGEGKIDVSDVTAIINIILGKK